MSTTALLFGAALCALALSSADADASSRRLVNTKSGRAAAAPRGPAAVGGRKLGGPLRRNAAVIPASRMDDPTRPGTADCKELFFTQKLDHFGFGNGTQDGFPQTYQQRYYACGLDTWQPNGTIFYYTGNEANVDLFVNMTGLMWENRAAFDNALLIFAEHRYFGKSLPFPGEAMPAPAKLKYLTTDQALADYATHIHFLRHEFASTVLGAAGNSVNSAVIAFGGSYGGMLCSWLRAKYPTALDGCIAGSAPIVNFEHMRPAYNPNAFNDVVTSDATANGGAAPHCADNFRAAFAAMIAVGESGSASGLERMSAAWNMCTPMRTLDDVYAVLNYAQNALGDFAMGSYPYPSAYMLLGGRGILPAYPMRVACSEFGQQTNFTSDFQLMAAANAALMVYFNATGEYTCLNPNQQVNEATAVVDYLWGYLACTSMFMPSGSTGRTDMFWPAPFEEAAQIAACQQQYGGTTPQPMWVEVQYGGQDIVAATSNTVFSNGQLDPWRPGGITNIPAWRSDVLDAAIVEDAGHHIDLFFSDPLDTPSIKAVRALEVDRMHRWVSARRRV
jgi:lysosomal Pro-X carboxypeptidase